MPSTRDRKASATPRRSCCRVSRVLFVFLRVERLHILLEPGKVFFNTFWIGCFPKTSIPEFGYQRVVDNGGIHATNGMDFHSDFAAESLDCFVFLVSGSGRIPLPAPLFADGISPEARFFLQKQQIEIAELVGGHQSTRAATDDHYLVLSGRCRKGELRTIPHLMTDLILLAAEVGIEACRRPQARRKWTGCGYSAPDQVADCLTPGRVLRIVHVGSCKRRIIVWILLENVSPLLKKKRAGSRNYASRSLSLLLLAREFSKTFKN